MYRLPAIAAAVSILWFATTAAQTECREEILVCESQCPVPRDKGLAVCVPKCRSIVVCELDLSTSGRLPESALPAGRLPKSRLPASRLPDSSLN